MPSARQQEKLYHALAYFAGDAVLHPFKTKLFKLLYYTDFTHFKKYGRPVTGADYFAWDKGPVPTDTWTSWRNRAPDFTDRFFVKRQPFPNGKVGERLVPRFKFDENLFSQSELDIMETLSKQHFKDNAEAMSEKTHLPTQPWDEVWRVQGNEGGHIPYEMALLRQLTEEDQRNLDLARLHDAADRQFAE